MKKQQHYKAALYCRLSVDDGNFGGSVSIETQKILLEQYCKDHKITDYKFYCDDGCSGTNFDRPSFKKMLSDIDEGKINLVIVKDLSRFGRNYVEAGMYVQRFTDSNIRFIAADDNYDSLVNSDDLLFPIKNVVNEMYARDVSKKTKAAKKAKARDGQFIGSKAPFGYKIDPNDRHHLIVDEPAAQVVKRIFRLASEGVGYNKMAKIFREEKVLTPIAYFNLNNPDYFKSDYWRKEFDWHVTSIRAILNNEVYLGKLVYGKQRNKSMKSKEKVRNPKEDWIVVENCHEPIITQELWDTVHKILNAKHRPAKAGEVQMFAGCDNKGEQLDGSPMKGGIVLFASGNANTSDPRIAAPADYEKVVAVAAIEADYRKASYSNYGTYTDISAPGGSLDGDGRIWSTTTKRSNNYEYLAGTSMACPLVSGVAALVIEKYGVGKKGFTPEALKEILYQSAYDLDEYNPRYAGQLGHGCVDAAAALEIDVSNLHPFILKSNQITDNMLIFSVSSSMSGNGKLILYNGIGSKVLDLHLKLEAASLHAVDITKLSAGYYTLVYQAKGMEIREKFIKY